MRGEQHLYLLAGRARLTVRLGLGERASDITRRFKRTAIDLTDHQVATALGRQRESLAVVLTGSLAKHRGDRIARGAQGTNTPSSDGGGGAVVAPSQAICPAVAARHWLLRSDPDRRIFG